MPPATISLRTGRGRILNGVGLIIGGIRLVQVGGDRR